MFTLHETLPTLYGKDISGKSKQWTATVYTDGVKARYTVEYGQVGGKLQLTSTDYTEGKNIGKKNETTALQQCCNEIRKKWNDKKEKERYSETLDDTDAATGSKVFPMLAHVFNPAKNTKIVFPCFVQPKLDGLRCLIMRLPSGEIITQSRTGGIFVTMGHITSQLHPFFEVYPKIVLDGELYTNEYPFEELCGMIKRTEVDAEKMRLVHFHIYDVILPTPAAYTERHAFIANNAHLFPPTFEIVKTEEVTNTTELKTKFTEYIQDGYEGIMLRNKAGLYVNNRRHDLQKYKEFEKDEFVIVGFKEAKGRDAGSVIWVCATKTGDEFDCRPIGSLEHRTELFKNAPKYIGKMLTIKYQELSEKGIPRFLSGKAIRIDI